MLIFTYHCYIASLIYSVCPIDIELFHLRMLLSHVPGTKSLEKLKTHENSFHETFKDAFHARNLLEDDLSQISKNILLDIFRYSSAEIARSSRHRQSSTHMQYDTYEPSIAWTLKPGELCEIRSLWFTVRKSWRTTIVKQAESEKRIIFLCCRWMYWKNDYVIVTKVFYVSAFVESGKHFYSILCCTTLEECDILILPLHEQVSQLYSCKVEGRSAHS